MGMGRDPTERTTPDLIPPDAVQDASASPKLPATEAKTETDHFLDQQGDGRLPTRWPLTKYWDYSVILRCQ